MAPINVTSYVNVSIIYITADGMAYFRYLARSEHRRRVLTSVHVFYPSENIRISIKAKKKSQKYVIAVAIPAPFSANP